MTSTLEDFLATVGRLIDIIADHQTTTNNLIEALTSRIVDLEQRETTTPDPVLDTLTEHQQRVGKAIDGLLMDQQ